MRGSGSPSQRNRESWAWRGSCSSHPSSEGSAGSGSTQREGCPATQDPEQVTARQSDALASPAPQPPSTFSLPLLTALGRSRPEAGAREIGKCSLWKMILQRWAEGRRGPRCPAMGVLLRSVPFHSVVWASYIQARHVLMSWESSQVLGLSFFFHKVTATLEL